MSGTSSTQPGPTDSAPLTPEQRKEIGATEVTNPIRDAAQALLDAKDYGTMLDRNIAWSALRAALSAPQPAASDALEVLKIVRQHPDFDDGGPLADALDAVIRGERPAILDAVDALAAGRRPPQPAAMSTIANRLRRLAGYLDRAERKEQASMVAGDLLALATELEAAPAATTAKRADGMPACPVERQLRRMLADKCGIQHLYRDDGEASGFANCLAFDFMRDDVNELQAKLRMMVERRWKEQKEAAPAADAVPVVAQWTWYSDEEGSWELRGPDYGSLAQGTEVRLITEADHLSAIAALQARIAELEAKLNTPELHDFSAAVVLEAAHQRERWGASHDVGKQPADWFWLLGYLGGKALNAAASGNTDKALHHTISTAAACANWHAAISGKHTQMRPGIDPVARGIDAAPSNPTTQPPEGRDEAQQEQSK